ncbi:hypothetical protein Celaphus_00009573 [Cervus elaphus hippelaphus]|uniref:Uncharacterized protein n=1 Tax=Cervus elaphus hippelaphus TaxID=46360 RepID=A0A212BZQ0_CEREH|nr:hypothetical protein Celaphus_00009573 [Cervus elaphus hippelaphus]
MDFLEDWFGWKTLMLLEDLELVGRLGVAGRSRENNHNTLTSKAIKRLNCNARKRSWLARKE